MSTWAHSVRLATADEVERNERMRERYGPRFYTCTTRGCDEPITHFVGWRYVTGKGGRVSSTERGRCLAHAESFAKKNSLEMPVEPSERVTRTGAMAVSDVVRSFPPGGDGNAA